MINYKKSQNNINGYKIYLCIYLMVFCISASLVAAESGKYKMSITPDYYLLTSISLIATMIKQVGNRATNTGTTSKHAQLQGSTKRATNSQGP